MKKILALQASGPNTAACVVVDGEVAAFAEEERFTRVKLATNAIPVRSAGFCLAEAQSSLADISEIAISWNMSKYPEYMGEFYGRRMSHPEKDRYSHVYENISLQEKAPDIFGKKLEMAFRRSGYRGAFPPIVYVDHHRCHAYSVFYPSPFERSLILVIDGSGEEMATSLWMGEGNQVRLLESYELPDSLGYFYAALTEYLGFSVFTGEGKVMGLAPYGKPNAELRAKLDEVIRVEGSGYRVNPEYIYFAPRTYSFRHTDKLNELLGRPPRVPESAFDDWHLDLAWEVQDKLERIVAHIVKGAVKKYGVRDICIAGGVAMNCKMNGMIGQLPYIDNCFVVPASNDAGACVGAAFIRSDAVGESRDRARWMTVYTGPKFSTESIVKMMESTKIRDYEVLSDDVLIEKTAALLASGAIIGWFQGRMEVGARALGNRSILANPAFPNMKDKINAEVKHREAFRPFAPAIMVEHAAEYFKIRPGQSYEPYHHWMLQAATAAEGVAQRIPAVVHVDGSIRPQVVSRDSNARFHALLSRFNEKTGVPVLLNTSFNVRGEPIICRPDEAIRCFYSGGLDALVMENVLLTKKK